MYISIQRKKKQEITAALFIGNVNGELGILEFSYFYGMGIGYIFG